MSSSVVGELLQKAQDAKTEAELACELDKALRYYDAIGHYDQSISMLDDILQKVSAHEMLWEGLVLHRQAYSDRMVCVCVCILE